VLPVNMPKYKAVAKRIHAIFHDFTLLVEPLSLDEAYLDVTESTHCHGSATLIAQKIRECIWQSEKLTASAGVAPNKFLAKIASGWKKPNGLFVILPQEIDAFIYDLPITELFGVGKVTAQKLHQLGFKTCADLQKFSLNELMHQFGKLGQRLYYYCRGIDDRAVEPNRAAKSLSVEQTFAQDIQNPADCQPILQSLFQKLQQRIQTHAPERQIKNLYIKIKFHDFKSMTAEIAQNQLLLTEYLNLFHTCYARTQKPVRLIGLGVHFQDKPALVATQQGNLF
jgi:DNA polymerase-4